MVGLQCGSTLAEFSLKTNPSDIDMSMLEGEDPSREDFVSEEDQQMLEEYALYGKHSERFTAMYYPQSRDQYAPSVLERERVVLVPTKQQQRCSSCAGELGYSVQRCFQAESTYCTNCLRKMGCCVLPKAKPHHEDFASSTFAPPSGLIADVISHILSFIPEYFQVARLARVSKVWLGVYNYGTRHESDIVKLKRYWISREIYYQFERKRNNPVIIKFCARFDLGALLGEWCDPTVHKDAMRWLNLCRLIALSEFYREEFRLAAPSGDSPPLRYTITPQQVQMVYGDTTITIPKGMYKGGPRALEPEKGEEGYVVTARRSSALSSNSFVKLFIDPASGIVEYSTGSQESFELKKHRRCLCL